MGKQNVQHTGQLDVCASELERDVVKVCRTHAPLPFSCISQFFGEHTTEVRLTILMSSVLRYPWAALSNESMEDKEDSTSCQFLTLPVYISPFPSIQTDKIALTFERFGVWGGSEKK